MLPVTLSYQQNMRNFNYNIKGAYQGLRVEKEKSLSKPEYKTPIVVGKQYLNTILPMLRNYYQLIILQFI
jgi:hypothetical protein